MIEIQRRLIGQYAVIQILGRMDRKDRFMLEDRLRSISSSDQPIAVYIEDFSHAPMFLLASLIALRNSQTRPDAAVTIVNAPAEFRFIIQAANLDHIFNFAPSLESLETEDSVENDASENS